MDTNPASPITPIATLAHGRAARPGSAAAVPDILLRHVERTTRNAFRTGITLAVLIVIASVVVLCINFNALVGPHPLSKADLLRDPLAAAASHAYVSLDADSARKLPFTSTTYETNHGTRTGREWTTAEFSGLLFDGHKLLVEERPGQSTPSRCVGTLMPMPEDDRHSFIDPQVPEIRSAYLPLLLRASDPKSDFRTAVIVCTAVPALILWPLIILRRAARFRASPHLHPSIRRLARYGDVGQQLASIDAQSATASTFPTAQVLDGWLIERQPFAFTLRPLGELVMASPMVTRKNGSITGYFTRFYERRLKTFDLSRPTEGNDPLLEICRRAPHIIIADDELVKRWKANPAAFVSWAEQQRPPG